MSASTNFSVHWFFTSILFLELCLLIVDFDRRIWGFRPRLTRCCTVVHTVTSPKIFLLVSEVYPVLF